MTSHRTTLDSLGLPGTFVDALAVYLDLVARWNARINLTGARSETERVQRLVADVLPARELLEPRTVLDVGSGNGSPGLVLAVLRPDLAVTLLEPRQRRWAFLREATRCLGRCDVVVERRRHDQYAGPPARNVTIRALDLSLAELTRLVGPGGQVLMFGSRHQGESGFQEEPGTGRIHRYRYRPG